MMGVLADMIINQDIANRRRQEQMFKKKMLRDISNPFEIGDGIFERHYR